MEKVSIIVPVYNAEKFIGDTLKSILNQSYKNFEVLCVDDQSTDGTIDIINNFMRQDSRIKLFSLPQKGGASIARNYGIRTAVGRYIAFLDADDVWNEKKLEKQINFMVKNSFSFTYTYFGIINEASVKQRKIRTSPSKVSYKKLLRGNTIGCLTVIYDSSITGLIQIERIDKRNDFALWLEILKKVDEGMLFPEVLSFYRVTDQSLSKKDGKFNLLKYHIQLHRGLQKFSWPKTIYLTFMNILNTYTIEKKYTKEEV